MKEALDLNLGMIESTGETKYLCVFGIYVLTKTVFECLKNNIDNGLKDRGKFELTTALQQALEIEGGTIVNLLQRRSSSPLLYLYVYIIL